MEANLGLSLLITVIGMGLVFACILLFWGLMVLLVRLTRDRTSEANPAEVAEPQPETDDLKRQAAVAAVAVALARARRLRRPEGAAALSPWQAAHRRAQPRERGTVE